MLGQAVSLARGIPRMRIPEIAPSMSESEERYAAPIKASATSAMVFGQRHRPSSLTLSPSVWTVSSEVFAPSLFQLQPCGTHSFALSGALRM